MSCKYVTVFFVIGTCTKEKVWVRKDQNFEAFGLCRHEKADKRLQYKLERQGQDEDS